MVDVMTEIRAVNPDLAKLWLATSPINRQLKTLKIEAFSRDMLAGRWTLNGATLVLDEDGLLMDGHHRLQAVVRSGVPVSFLVVSGVSRQVMSTVDNGTARTSADVLKLKNAINCVGLAATLRLLNWYDTTDRTYTTLLRVVSNAEMSELHARYDNAPSVVARVYHDTGLKAIRAINAGFCAPMCKAYAAASETAEHFVSTIASGAGLELGDPRLTLRNWFAARPTRRRTERHDIMGVTIKAWNAFLIGSPVKQLKITEGEAFPIMRGV